MSSWKRAVLFGGTFVLAMACPLAFAAVQTANIQVTGTSSFTISYVLAQQATSLQVKIFPAAGGAAIRTITEADNSATGPMGPGTHGLASGNLPPETWDGLKDDSTQAPNGTYYAQITTTGAPVAAVTLMADRVHFAHDTGTGRLEARTVYGGAANRDPSSPYHNLTYFGAGKTNSNNNGSSGALIVNPDGTSVIYLQDGAEGAFDYVDCGLMSDGTILLGGPRNGQKKFRNVSQANGTLIADYEAGKIASRAMQVFGSGATARVYFVDDSATATLTGAVEYLPSLTATGTPPYTTIVPNTDLGTQGATNIGTNGLVVNRSETSLWVCGFAATSTNLFIYRYDKVGTAWVKSTTFTYDNSVTTGRFRGIALSPDEKTLWVADTNAADVTLNQVFAVDAATGVNLGANYTISTYYGGGYLTAQSIVTTASDANFNSSTGYNLMVAGYNGIAASTSADSVSVFAPPDNGSTDVTRSDFFDVAAGATAVHVTAGPTVSAITDTSATITWDTDFRASTTVHYGGAAGSYTSPDVVIPGVTSHHVVVLTNLVPGGTYFYQVQSDKDPLTSATATGQFSTMPDIAIISESLNATSSSAALTFVTNVASAGVAHWGDTPAFTSTDISIASGTSHTVNFTGLTAGKTYYFQLVLTGTNAMPLTTLTSVFATASATGTAGSVTDNAFGLAHKVNLLGGTGTSAVSLPVQGIPTLSPTPGPDLPAPIFDEGVVAYNGFLYVIGGADGSATSTAAAQNTVYIGKILGDGTLDSAFGTGGWLTSASPLPVVRKEISNCCFAYTGFLYVVGGTDGTTVQTSVLYAPINPTTGELGAWQGLDGSLAPVNPFPAGRTRGSARVVDGYILVSGGAGGGVNSTNYVAQIRPDGSTGTWQTDTPLAGTRWKQRTLANNHTVYSLGGDNAAGAHISSVFLSSVMPDATLLPFYANENYPTQGQFVTDVGHYAMAAGILAGKIVTAGGGNLSGVTGDDDGRTVISYSPIAANNLTGAWTAVADLLPAGIEDTDAAVFNNFMYVAGGRALGVKGTTTVDPNTTGVATVSVLAAAADPESTGFAYAGTLESKVIDLGSLTNLKHLKVNVTGGGSVEVRYRFANADGVFTDWFAAASADADITGGARWFQYELVLKGDGTVTPTVSSVTLTTAAGAGLPGDIDKSGVVDGNDVKLALRVAAGLINANDASVSFTNGDLNGDHKIDLLDAVGIQRKINGK